MDAIDRLLMNARLHYLGSAARITEPVQKLAVLTCMDARIDVSGLLGLRPGYTRVIRNAGGRATDDLRRSLASRKCWARGRSWSSTTRIARWVGSSRQSSRSG